MRCWAHLQRPANALLRTTEAGSIAAPFARLCPSGNCIDDCHNYTRIFQAVPDDVEATVQGYGQPDKSGKVNVTVFGLCTNLVSANKLVTAKGSERVKSFFTLGSQMNACPTRSSRLL